MKNIGVDLVEIKKIKDVGLDKIANRILSLKEHECYATITNKEVKYSYVAGRWAAKEAIFKAYAKGDLTHNYSDWSILNHVPYGLPYVIDPYQNKIMISISHTDNYAIAFVVLM
ncbi:MAG: 4'-phosphopantetheinyl transferase superfamily protein [Candidatus Phytoplasma pruni]|nr:4'-phosphopantetheinyl transferase superfamily protein [Candidatus Phytoplasma pruni]MDW3617746.1 4'-phosphopantetheinyl transferase superfamily protein [Candidatus Phytoplasma pruni]